MCRTVPRQDNSGGFDRLATFGMRAAAKAAESGGRSPEAVCLGTAAPEQGSPGGHSCMCHMGSNFETIIGPPFIQLSHKAGTPFP